MLYLISFVFQDRNGARIRTICPFFNSIEVSGSNIYGWFPTFIIDVIYIYPALKLDITRWLWRNY